MEKWDLYTKYREKSGKEQIEEKRFQTVSTIW